MLIRNKKISQRCLKKKYEFSKIQRTGRRIHSKFITLIVNNTKTQGLFGLVVAKSVGKANVRNLIKRRLRHLLYMNFFMIHCMNLIVLALPEIVNASFHEIEKDIQQSYGRLRSYHRPRISYTAINK